MGNGSGSLRTVAFQVRTRAVIGQTLPHEVGTLKVGVVIFVAVVHHCFRRTALLRLVHIRSEVVGRSSAIAPTLRWWRMRELSRHLQNPQRRGLSRHLQREETRRFFMFSEDVTL